MLRIQTVILSLVIASTGFVGKTYGQPCVDESNSCQYIYRIKVIGKSEKTGNPWSTYMTGFKLREPFYTKDKKISYLVTALHGVVKGVEACGSIKALTFIADHVIGQNGDYDVQYTMKICGFDHAKDLLYLTFYESKTPRQPFYPTRKPYLDEGLQLAGPKDRVTKDHKLIIQGFSTLKGRTKPVQQDYNPYGKLGKLFIPENEEQQKKLDKLISPNVDVEVLSLNSNNVQGGDSGAPIVGTTQSDNQKLYGVGNGARLDRSGSAVVSWAIPLTMYDLQHPQVGDEKIEKKILEIIANHRNLGIELEIAQYATEQTDLPTNNDSPFSFPKVRPFISIGGNLSWLYNYNGHGLELRKRPGDLNTFMDLYAEISLTSWFRIGVYGTSPYLQYGLLRGFTNGLPLEPDALEGSQKGVFKQVGLQASIALWRGILWEGYIGGGMLPVKINSLQPNKRIFAGIRHYLVARRWLSAEGRVVWMSPEVQLNTWQPRLDNAAPNSQTINLNSLYVCAGLCLVIPHW